MSADPQPTPRPTARFVHGCPADCRIPHTHAHTHPGGHFCTWGQYGQCDYEPEKEGD